MVSYIVFGFLSVHSALFRYTINSLPEPRWEIQQLVCGNDIIEDNVCWYDPLSHETNETNIVVDDGALTVVRYKDHILNTEAVS
jgi:hypothetical protein